MPTPSPDLFTNVHRGIRAALFAACLALGRAGHDPDDEARARGLLGDALRFVRHHGENEELLLVPQLTEHAPAVAERMTLAHAALDSEAQTLAADADRAEIFGLYHRACAFTASYLQHLHQEELELEPLIRAALPLEVQASFGRESIARTAPADQQLMLGFMVPAMPRADADALLEALPAPLAAALAAKR